MNIFCFILQRCSPGFSLSNLVRAEKILVKFYFFFVESLERYALQTHTYLLCKTTEVTGSIPIVALVFFPWAHKTNLQYSLIELLNK